MKVLLVTRGEPYIYYDLGAVPLDPDLSPGFPFTLETIHYSRFIPGESSDYDAWIIPADLFLAMDPATRAHPIIAYGSAEIALACMAEGVADFMRDVWSIPELAARLYRLWNPAIAFGDSRLALEGLKLKLSVGCGESRGAELGAGEAGILRLLIAARGSAVSATSLDRASGSASASGNAGVRGDIGVRDMSALGSRALSMRIARLRRKLGALEPSLAACIVAARHGYRWGL